MAAAGIAMAVVILVAGGLSTSSSAAPVAFVETFDGVPGSPQPFDSPHWDVQVHERQQVTNAPGFFTPLNAQHGPGCEGPSITHLVDSQEEAVFRCNDHVMTSLNGVEYGVIYLTPDHMLDWSGGTATLDFSVSTAVLSQRDWIDFYITPFADNMALPLSADSPDLNGEPAQFLKVTIEHGGMLVVNEVGVNWPIASGSSNFMASGIPAGVDQSVHRSPFRLTVSGGSVKFERLSATTSTGIAVPGRVFFEEQVSLGFTSGVVQFGHHSYSPEKDNSGVPATWHWDSFALNPAIQFTMNAVNQRHVQGAGPHTVTFPPAPAGAFLRFAAWGAVRVNGVTCAPQGSWVHYESAQNYFCPIPAGSTSATIQMSGIDWYSGGPYMATGFAVWAQGGGSGGSGTPATATATPVTPSNGTISGVVSLEGRTSAAGVLVRAMPGNVVATTGASGAFTLTGVQPGTSYTVTASRAGYLSAQRGGISATTGTVTLPTVTLLGGDIDGDGQIGIVDLAATASDFDGPPTSGATDVNGNGVVDIVDLAIVSQNFDRSAPGPW